MRDHLTFNNAIRAYDLEVAEGLGGGQGDFRGVSHQDDRTCCGDLFGVDEMALAQTGDSSPPTILILLLFTIHGSEWAITLM